MSVPPDLVAIIDMGFTERCRSRDDDFQIYDVRFFEPNSITSAKYNEWQIIPFVAFGSNAAGDLWGYRGDNIAIFPHDYEEAELVAPNMSAFLFQQVLLMASHVQLADKQEEADLLRRLRDSARILAPVFSAEMVAILNEIGKEPSPEYLEKWTLVSESWARGTINEVCPFRERNSTFIWMEV